MAETDYKTLYESVFNINRDAIIFFNKTVITNANQTALELFEVSSDEFIGHNIYEYTHDEQTSKQRVERRLKGEPEFYLSSIETRSGRKEIEVSSTPVNLTGITSYSIVRDVTERKRIEERYQTIIEQSADLIFVTNASGVVFVNPKGLEYLGREEEEVIGKTTLNLIHPDYWEMASSYAEERRAGGYPPSQYRLKMVRKDGEELEVELHASYIEWDGVPSSLTIARDVNKQILYDKKLEELHRAAAELIKLSDMQEIAELVVVTVDRILGYKRVSYGIVHDDKYTLLVAKPSIVVNEVSLNGSGISIRALRTGKNQIRDDVRKDPSYINAIDENEEPTISEFAAPIFVKGKPVALLNIESEKINAFTEEDKKLIIILVDHITATLEKLEYQKQLEALHQYSNRIANCRTREEVAHETMKVIREVIGHRVGSFGYVDEEGIHFLETVDSKIEYLALTDSGITVKAVNTGKSQLVNDTRLSPDYVSSRYSDDVKTLSELDVPIKIDDTVVAVINLENSTPNTFNIEDQQLLETLAIHISSTLKNIEYREKIEYIHSHTLTLDQVESIEEALISTYEMLLEKLGYPIVDIIKVDNEILYDARTSTNDYFKLKTDGPGITARAARTRETQLVNDTRLDSDYTPNQNDVINRSELVVPVYLEEKLVYLLNIENSEPDAFNEEDRHLVEMIGIVLGHALSKIQRLEYLEEIVNKRTQDLTEANTRLEMLSEMKTRFVSTATHELRTPLTIVKGYLELACESDDIEVIKKYLKVVLRNTDRFEVLVNDLLDQQRIEEGRLTINRRKFELNNYVSEIIDEMRPLINSRKQRFKLDLPLTETGVNWDEARFQQLMINLVSNASKYSEEDTLIKVSVKKMKREVLISIADEGYGFTEEEIEKLFYPFPDLQRPVLTERSIGLGLSISKGIVDLHGGEIWVESEGHGHGSVFKLRLPVE